MKKKILLVLMVIAIGVFALAVISVSAETYGNLTYSVSNGEVTITDCDTSASGDIVIPDTLGGYPVTCIGFRAFYWCGDITNIIIPYGVTRIWNESFLGCSSLISITIPDSVTRIDGNAFSACSSLESITIPDNVTIIAGAAFLDCSSLESITIPDSVTSIGDGAFYNTAYYNNTSNWDNNALYIGSHLIAVNTSISGEYSIKNGTLTIADGAFSGCSNLESVIIPDSVTSIDDWMFSSCHSLTSITIPDSVTSIGHDAFYTCHSLESITIPDSVTSIGDSAFSYCRSLTSITIPDSITNINDYAFEYCSNLTSITISNSVTSIGDATFNSCSNLKDIYYTGTEAEWNEITIGYDNENLTNATIHFMPGTKTTLSNNDKTFTVTPINIGNGKTIILALYNGDILVEMQSVVYAGEAIPFTTDKTYTKAKVMVWNDSISLNPVCDVEIVK